MAENFYTILTNLGKAQIANASALGSKVNFSTLVLGDSNGAYYNPTETQNSLVHEVWKGPIGNVIIDKDNSNWIALETVIPTDVGGFMIREVGILDDKGNLLAVGKYPETYKPALSEGSAKDLRIRIVLEVTNTAAVTLKVDPSIILATKKDLEILQNNINNIKVPVTSVNGQTGKIELKAADIKTENGETVESHLADYRYQIPQISGTQIRINKLSNTNRLFFQLSSDLAGGAITISTDGGTTSMPLKDVDGNAITILEKGFVEVVADATFFTLRNKGISATQKQQLIDIVNAAKSNQSTIKTNIANALNNVSVLQALGLSSSSAWNDILNAIPNVKTGKKTKTGTTTATTITYGSGYKLTVSGLDFKPSFVFARKSYGGISDITIIAPILGFVYQIQFDNGAGHPPATYAFNDNGFDVQVGSGGGSYDWIAIE